MCIRDSLKGKHKPQYTPHVDTGDFVIIINADKIRVTGTKAANKVYYRHSGYPGGLKSETFTEAMAKHPERVVEHAVKGMLPKNTLGRAMGKKLKVYTGAEHPHLSLIHIFSRSPGFTTQRRNNERQG